MPTGTVFIGLEGANHAQFGAYGPQKGDVVASMSLAEQHDHVATLMLDFINP
jgi:N-acetylglucosamine kinase-like BadF-type ATPase